MKNNRLLHILLAMTFSLLLEGCSYSIYSVNDRPVLSTSGGILYALPRTEIVAEVQMLTYDQTEAVYARYATEMLGAPDSTEMGRVRVTLSSHNVPDPRAYYYVVPRRISVDVDKNHLLHSVGLPTTDFSAHGSKEKPGEKVRPTSAMEKYLEYNLYQRSDTFYVKGDKPGNPSKVATKPDSRSLRQRALAAAQELREVQEKLKGLEEGDYDEAYSFEQMQYVQKRLRQRESDLLQLFVGTPEVKAHTFGYVPKDEYKLVDSQSVVLFYYSPVMGVADSGDRGAVPVSMTVRCKNQTRNAARFVKFRTDGRDKHVAKQHRCFKYRMAEQAEVELSCEYFTTKTIVPVVQFGPTVDLPKRRFEALFDPETGDLLYYNGRP